MSIVALNKVTLCGLSQDKQTVLETLQDLGCMHLTPLRSAPEELEAASTDGAKDAYKTLRYLLDTPRKRRLLREEHEFNVATVVEQSLANKQRLRDVSDRRDFLAHRIEQLKPWGDFRFPPGQDLADYKLWFYIVPIYQMRQIQSEGLVWQEVYRDNRNAYIVVVAKDEPPAEALPVPRVYTGAFSLSDLRLQLEQAEIELEEIAAERETLTRWIYLLSRNLARAEDEAALAHAGEQALDEEQLFAVQGWAAEGDVPALQQLAKDRNLALLAAPPEPTENPPTLLDNPKQVDGGEDLVEFYQVPAYRDWDPSGVVFYSFALFFAMILSDAGYALVLGVLLFSYWKKLGGSATGRRMRNVGAALVGASFVWGVLVGSYFGVAPPPNSVLGAFKFIDMNNFGFMMGLSVSIGCVHMIMANAIRAYHAPNLAAAGPQLGWIAIIIGALFLWLGRTDEAVGMESFGTVTMVLGFAVLIWFTGTRKVHTPMDALLRVLSGMTALANVTTMFGDVLSYMRLFALGLASASLALTFNDLAGQVREAVPGLGLLLSLLILLVGHTLNLGLSIMSGVVHGLRLNVIEFFKWGLSEEGYPFKSFAKKEIEQ